MSTVANLDEPLLPSGQYYTLKLVVQQVFVLGGSRTSLELLLGNILANSIEQVALFSFNGLCLFLCFF